MKRSRLPVALRMLIILCGTVLFYGLASGCASTSGKKPPCDPRKTYCPNTSEIIPPDTAPSSLNAADDYGIEIVSLRVTAAGHLLDLRYRVKDKEKASPIFDRSNKAYLKDDSSGFKLSVPRMAKVGPLRQTNFSPDPNRVYFILFGNTGGLLKSGSRVTLEVGDCTIGNLVVQ